MTISNPQQIQGSQSLPPNALITSQDFLPQTSGIITSDGQTIPIHTYLLEVCVIEDLTSPCITGTAVVAEGNDLIANFKIHGNEYIVINYVKPGMVFPYKKAFRIFSITDRKIGASGRQEYTIHFCSEELILSQLQFVSKAYSGMLVSDMIKDIMFTYLKTDPAKFVYCEQTQGNMDIIVPKMQPFEAIPWLMHRAYNNISSAFFFYENVDGFQLTSYETLIGKKYQTYQSFFLNPKLSTAPIDNMTSVNYFEIEREFDTIDTTRMGGYAASLMTFDFNALTYFMTLHNADNSAVYPLMNNQVLNNGATNRLNLPPLRAFDSFLKYVPTQDYRTTTNPQRPEKWLMQPYVRLAMLNSFGIKMVVPGDPTLSAGRIVHVEIPKGVVQFGNYNINELRSAKYLIKSVQHKFDFRENPTMVTNLTVVTDSIASNWNPPDYNNQGLQKVQTK